MIIFVLIIVILILVLLLLNPTEAFRRGRNPWDTTSCKLKCYQAGQRQLPWLDGQVDGPWNDPAVQPEAIFNVAACMRSCENYA